MPEIEFCGFTYNNASNMKTPLDELIKKIGLQDDAVSRRPRHQSSSDLVETCDSNRVEQPFVRLWSTEVVDIMKILSAFQNDSRFHVDVSYPNGMTPSGLFYFPAEDIVSGQWRSKFGIKNVVALKDADELTGALINAKDKDSNAIFEYAGYNFFQIFTTGNATMVHPGDSYEEYFKEVKVLVEKFIDKGESFVFYPWKSSVRRNFRFRIKEYKE